MSDNFTMNNQAITNNIHYYLKKVSIALIAIITSSIITPNIAISKQITTINRQHAIIAGKYSYYPSKIVIFKNETLRIFLTSVTEKPNCMIIKDKNIFLSAKKGDVTEKIITFNKTGNFKFHCPSNNIEGTISVIQKIDKEKSRKIASTEQSEWMPREE